MIFSPKYETRPQPLLIAFGQIADSAGVSAQNK
jgi:hypothetical protein